VLVYAVNVTEEAAS